MRSRFTGIWMVGCLLIANMAAADGMLYRLPKDGTWARYDLTAQVTEKDKEAKTVMDGTFTMSSVGQVTENGEPCRWIETKIVWKETGGDRILRKKVLIPEKHLTAGANPAEHVIRGWNQSADEKPSEQSEQERGEIAAFLAGPSTDGEKLEKQMIEVKFGKFECEGATGKVEVAEKGNQLQLTYESRLHDETPFGVVSCDMNLVTTQDETPDMTGTLRFTLSEVGTDATSEMPEAN